MSDSLSLSLWYPNLRLAGLAEKLTRVLGQFATHGGDARVFSATVWPVSWSEAPVFQHVYGRGTFAPAVEEMGLVAKGQQRGAEIEVAVADALELLHDDYAYEFQIGWTLWELELPGGTGGIAGSGLGAAAGLDLATGRDSGLDPDPDPDSDPDSDLGRDLDRVAGAGWVRATRLVRVVAYGPEFDDGAYEQEGHIRIDFGNDSAFLVEDADLNQQTARRVEENVRQLIELTGAVEKRSGATARLLWSEMGESLAARLAKRLNQVN